MYTTEELLRMTRDELIDAGVCPTCFNRAQNGAFYGDNTNTLLYQDNDIECFLVGNPRAAGHLCISSILHFHDMSESPDALNAKIFRFAKQFMIIIKEVYQCERVYMCTMCDGPNNHYHIQLIPRYASEKRGSGNFVKPRMPYIFDAQKFTQLKERIAEYANKNEQ